MRLALVVLAINSSSCFTSDGILPSAVLVMEDGSIGRFSSGMAEESTNSSLKRIHEQEDSFTYI